VTSRKNYRKKSRLKNRLINIGLFFLLLIGVALIFNNQIRSWIVQYNSHSYATNRLSPDTVKKNMQEETTFDFDSVESLSTESVLKAQLKNKNLPVIGSIAIPDVAVNLPIFKGLSNVALLTGAGTMKPDETMGQGNYALASHRTQDGVSLFSPLERTKVGQLIYITDLTTVYTYRITSVEKVEPTRVELIDDVPDKKMITLITCGDLEATTRIAVQGELEATTPIEKASKTIMDAFEVEQKTLEDWVS
jgi:sortase A